jgi:hypothetical protein
MRNYARTTGFEFAFPLLQPDSAGRPRLDIPAEALRSLQSVHNSWREVARVLNVSYRTLLRRRTQFGMTIANLQGPRETYSSVSDDLKDIVRQILQTIPNAGESYVIGALRTRGTCINVQRYRIRDALREVDPLSRVLRRTFAIVRRRYTVPSPNALWYVECGVSVYNLCIFMIPIP